MVWPALWEKYYQEKVEVLTVGEKKYTWDAVNLQLTYWIGIAFFLRP